MFQGAHKREIICLGIIHSRALLIPMLKNEQEAECRLTLGIFEVSLWVSLHGSGADLSALNIFHPNLREQDLI